MNNKIIYIAIYRVLEALEEEHPNEKLAHYLDLSNPYVFKDRKSADPVFFEEFEKWIDNKNIVLTAENSFEMAKRYIAEETEFIGIFAEIDVKEWQDLIEMIKEEELELVDE